MGNNMFQNIKVDIIYYKTATDFEMEFNLCGCCRMRLLTDKAPDRKSMVHNLARAVSRSRVIIIVGGLFGEEGVLNTVAGAIGKPLAPIDNKLYGIADNSEISVISGATPLVTSDGYFGGCIIESGPQSMVLLSDSKSVRKAIMTTLIHPYIEELCATELKAKAESTVQKPQAAEPEVPPVPEIPVTPPILAEPDITAGAEEITDLFSSTDGAPDSDPEPTPEPTETEPDEQAEDMYLSDEEDEDVTVEQAEPRPVKEEPQPTEAEEAKPLTSFATAEKDGVSLDGGMIFETDDYRSAAKDAYVTDDEDSDFYIAPEKLHRAGARRKNELYSLDTHESRHYHIDEDTPELPRSFFKENLGLMIVLIVLLLIVAVLCYCIFIVPAKTGVSSSDYLRNIFDVLFARQ